MTSDDAIPLEIWADVVCPWCYLGSTRLAAAVAAHPHGQRFVVRHRAFELDPGLARGERHPVAEYLGRKYGGGIEAGRRMTAQVTEVAAGDGLRLDFDRAVKTSTFDAHRLALFAGRADDVRAASTQQREVVIGCYRAHFEQGLALDDHDVLTAIGTGAGLDADRLRELLAGDDRADQVHADEAFARELGVSGVPFVVADRRLAVPGAQSREVYRDLLDAALTPAD